MQASAPAKPHPTSKRNPSRQAYRPKTVISFRSRTICYSRARLKRHHRAKCERIDQVTNDHRDGHRLPLHHNSIPNTTLLEAPVSVHSPPKKTQMKTPPYNTIRLRTARYRGLQPFLRVLLKKQKLPFILTINSSSPTTRAGRSTRQRRRQIIRLLYAHHTSCPH